ncbi:hypothetical protein EMIHUDRAFT_245338 [Emiliania huxleyi CCMP1516]|uniref:FAD-binding domain-containing protein n=2 Tax=Emiliania huxleyi TaxID=2903 RepID=A0A0D3IXY7_EMIH1|nr:hypothetical protein EMIHUDRAFT_245338 [Emiliania huxleyi CCMP1516]EOD16122.1 hypothetical protein EMIHUDRAFT_245338 [Emiliania huxleyi CCMP1516]|eukprot:XP_005768551.1 hypothetical protein EMIHUDRAFT_245338 [Emiliania huxleyi CCMP1516]
MRGVPPPPVIPPGSQVRGRDALRSHLARILGVTRWHVPRVDGVIEADVAIAGAGLGGLALSAALRRRGFRVVVLERAAAARYTSQGTIALWPNGLAALEAAGGARLPAAVSKRGVAVEATEILNYGLHGSESTRRIEVGPHGVSAFFIPWAKVQQELMAAAEEGEAVGGAVRGPWLLESWTLDGRGVLSALSSALRRWRSPPWLMCSHEVAGFAEDAEAVEGSPGGGVDLERINDYSTTNWNAILRHAAIPGPPVVPRGESRILNLASPKLSCYLVDCGEGELFWQIRQADAAWGHAQRGAGLGRPGIKARLLSLFDEAETAAGVGARDILRVIRATAEEGIFERRIFDTQPLPAWSSAAGRVTLLGDAAHALHPTPGQGANQAFEDAAALAEALCDAADRTGGGRRLRAEDVPAAVATYEERRRRRATAVQAWAAGGGRRQRDGTWQRTKPGPEAEAFRQWVLKYPAPGEEASVPPVPNDISK